MYNSRSGIATYHVEECAGYKNQGLRFHQKGQPQGHAAEEVVSGCIAAQTIDAEDHEESELEVDISQGEHGQEPRMEPVQQSVSRARLLSFQ